MASTFMSPGALLIPEWKLGWIGEKTKQNLPFLVWFRHLALTLVAKVIQSNKKDESGKWQKEILITIVILIIIIIIIIMITAIIWKYTKHDKITKWKNEKTK